MSKLLVIVWCAAFSGCMSLSLNMVHSEGVATDLIDETHSQSPSTAVDLNASVPASIVP